MRCCSGLILDWFKRADYKQHYYSELRQAVVREEMMLLRRFKQTYRPECVHTNFIVVIWKDLLKKDRWVMPTSWLSFIMTSALLAFTCK